MHFLEITRKIRKKNEKIKNRRYVFSIIDVMHFFRLVCCVIRFVLVCPPFIYPPYPEHLV